MCSDDNEENTLFKCIHTDDTYKKVFTNTEFDAVCPNDPNHYQVCGGGHSEVITNEQGLLCGYYMCDFTWHRSVTWTRKVTSSYLKYYSRECMDG